MYIEEIFRWWATPKKEIIYDNSDWSRGLILFFIYYLIWDSIFIFYVYPTIGGWHHHIPYLIFMSLSLFYKCPGVFVISFPMEVSTIFLSIGHIWPTLRQDVIVCISFFTLRVLYHFFIWTQLYRSRNDSPFLIYPFCLLPWFVHIWWSVKMFTRLLKMKHDHWIGFLINFES